MTILELWERLSDIPIDENECIEEEFEHFPKGVFREDVWHWLETRFDVRVCDLMFLTPDTKE